MIDTAQIAQASELCDDLAPFSTTVSGPGPTELDRAGYYGIPLLKPPRWRWEIALYFFLEGVSSGSYILGTMADLFAHGRNTALVRHARYISLMTLIPCPPLLIADLGRPERFHHMLRIVKLTSPMNTGAWALTAFGPFVAALALAEYRNAQGRATPLIPRRTTAALGLPVALTMVAYPGVLLSTTSNPIWAKTRVLGALFVCSSLSSAAAALALSARGQHARALTAFENITTICEGAAVIAYLATTRNVAEPLLSGKEAPKFWTGVGASIVLPVLLRGISPRRGTTGSKRTMAASIAAIAGGLLLKWAITHAGRASALDASAAHRAAEPNSSASGWRASLPNHPA